MKEELLKRLDLLAAKLNTTTQFLWQTLLSQSRLEGYIDLCQEIGCIILTGGLIYLTYRLLKVALSSSRHDELCGIMSIFAGVGAVIFWVISICCATAWITPMFNPNYWALKQILNAVK